MAVDLHESGAGRRTPKGPGYDDCDFRIGAISSDHLHQYGPRKILSMNQSDADAGPLYDESFTRITEWERRSGKIKPSDLDWDDSSGWLSAFVLEDATVRYIGLTDHVLRSRLDHYSYGTQTTNKRVRQSIAFELKRHCPVFIYGRPERSSTRRQAEEMRLLRRFNPA